MPNGLLVTLKRGTDPSRTLKRLLDRRALADGRPINLSGAESDENLISEVNGETYFHMEGFLAEGKSPTPETNEPPEGPVWEW